MGSKRSNESTVQIPVINISEANESDAIDTADRLVDAITRYGFVFVKGEGMGFTRPILDNVFALVRSKHLLQAGISKDLDSQKGSSHQM